MTNTPEEFFGRYPELHHYTGWEAFKGIFTFNTFWATHYKYLNDREEVEHLKAYMERLVPYGNREKRRRDKAELHKLYARTFNDFVTPFIVSFSTHASGSDFDRHNGVLGQWGPTARRGATRSGGYGKCGFAVVLDTKRLDALMQREFEAYRYTQTTFSNVVYNHGEKAFHAAFQPLIQEARWFIYERATAHNYERGKEFVDEFIKTTVSFKHSRWASENEVRIISHPQPAKHLKYISDDDPDDIKALRGRRVKEICHRPGSATFGGRQVPFIKLFEGLGEPLPIKRIIVAPGPNQEGRWQQAVELVGGRVPVHRSKVTLSPSVP
jgi:hypothetical protein